MEEITLGRSGRQTTRLGFGCSSIMGAMGRRDSLGLLETAFDAGVRHFDVAPMYGYGAAEGCLGEFLQHHRAQVTVTTKYGIPLARNASLLSLCRRFASPLIKRLPGLKQHLVRVANAAAGADEKASFTADQARESLARSLASLRTDHIDLWLLHEVEAADLEDDGLMRFLEDEVQKGTIGSFGIGSEGNKIPALISERPAYCGTVQYEWSVLDAAIPAGGAFRIHHRALTNHFRSLHAALGQSAEVCRRWSEEVGADLSNAEVLARLMLRAALVMNPASVILFSSKSPQHIRRNVEAAGDPALEPVTRRLYNLVRAERDQLLPQPGAEIR